ncbi:MAG: zinc ribbon domain-containing protein [Desulfobacterales bacterium]|jgi:putative FmdB family regulatory protein|nr:zinc ribbon domain-containing protein [Desulfobacterales bacterium]
MPIFEFKCMKCEEFVEFLVMKDSDEHEVVCPKCKSENLERVLSSTNYSMKSAPSGGGGAAEQSCAQTRTCSGGSCTTYNIPGEC